MTTMGKVGLVGGSGIDLLPLFDSIDEERPFHTFEQLPSSRVAGHKGGFVSGVIAGRPAVLQCGRLHVYEDIPVRTVQQTIDVHASLGVEEIILTNAAGGLLETMEAGDLLAIREALVWPCGLWPHAPATVPCDFTIPGCTHEGAYVWVHGPSYETRAEIRTMQVLGGAAVGMSTAPELERCHQLGLPVAAVSCITNKCFAPEKLTHEHVLRVAREASARLVELLRFYLSAAT